MAHHFTTLALVAAVFAGSASSQVIPGVFGYQVTGQLGTAGTFCWSFSCTPEPLAVVTGETLTMQINAPYQSFFAIGASFSGPICLAVPGLENRLVLGLPIVTLRLGVVGQNSPILACWGGFDNVLLPLPNGLPSGLSFTTQAIAVVPNQTSPNGVSFSTAVTATVQ